MSDDFYNAVQAIIVLPVVVAMVVAVFRQIGSNDRLRRLEERITAVEDRQHREWDR